MTYSYLPFLFRGTRSEEKIQLNQDTRSLMIGQIICTVLDLDSDFFRREQLFLDKIQAIEEAYLKSGQGSRYRDENEAQAALQQLRAILCSTEFEDEELALLHRLIVFLPCFYAYGQAHALVMRTLPNTAFLNEVTQCSGKDDSESKAIVRIYEQMNHEVKKHANEYSGWNCFLSFLDDNSKEYPWSIVAKEIFGVNRGNSYRTLYEGCIAELRRLRLDLQQSLFLNSSESTQLLGEVIPGPRVYQGSVSLIGPESDDKSRFSPIYEIESLSELVRAELMLLHTIDREVLQCKVCGKYFVPYRTKADACQRSNEEYGGKTCAQVYSQMKYSETHPNLDLPMGKLYLRHYKTYSKWANESTAFVTDNNALVYGEGLGQDEVSKITAEITGNQDSWREKAKAALFQLEAGAISEDQFKELIKLPTSKERSPLYTAFRKEISLINGNLLEG